MAHFRYAFVLAAVFMTLWAVPAAAVTESAGEEEGAEEAGTYETAFSLGAVSDYRYRGLSLSNKKPALQTEVSVNHENGLYARLWGSTIADNGGADIETQVSFGYYVEFGAFNADVQAAYYIYPEASAANYGEVTARLGREIGPAELGASLSYAPAQKGTGNLDNLYVGLDGNLPLIGETVALAGTFGVEEGAFGDRKLDWSLGMTAEMAGLSLGLMYVDSSRTLRDPLGKPILVASVGAAF